MAESRVVFTKSKMNKDLDERILTPGEYRDGFNISVSKSEGPDEGVVENVLGNTQLTNFTWNNFDNVDVIGVYEDTNNDRIYLFATDFTDSSDDQLSEFAYAPFVDGGKTVQGAGCFIAYRDLVTGAEDILVSGNWLNFSKTHPIYAVDLVEDLLFWTDNRNQPRKINVETAIANPETYYLNEDHISVSKYMPYKPLQLVWQDASVWKSSMINETEQYLPPHALWPVGSSGSTSGQAQINFSTINNDVFTPSTQLYFINLNFPELGIFKVSAKTSSTIDYQWPSPDFPSLTSAQTRILVEESAEKFTDRGSAGNRVFQPNDVLAFFWENPDYNVDYDGDEDYLKERFVRFSYRFKYDDGEYSLMAPFTQAAFVPKQYGYFIDSHFDTYTTSMPSAANTQPTGAPARKDERDAASSGIVKFMENQASTIKFRLELPEAFGLVTPSSQADFSDNFKVESIEILLKESDGLAIRVVEEIKIADAFSGTSGFYIYDYLSNKPFKTLPEAVTTRVHDKVPIKALAQSTTGNRVMYGNFVEKHASPDNLNYFLGYREKPSNSTTPIFRQTRKEYPNHTVKQNRSYKVGVVLVDRYGRSSNVILRDPTQTLGIGKKDSTIYAPYSGGGDSPLNWPGNSITVNFLDVIPTAKTSDGYPGVFTSTNPLGYYSYKVVVQQQQQEYYNVYVPGATSGVITFSGKLGTGSVAGDKPTYVTTTQFSNIVLFGDNINKVPKELADVGPTEEIYGSETLLYPRVATGFLSVSSNISTNASVLGYEDQLPVAESRQIDGKFTSEVSSIISYNDLGAWTGQRGNNAIATSSYPNDSTDYIDPLYLGASKNPFVAQIETSFLIGLSKKDQEDATNPKFSRALNVFETNPVESNIEIYWESTTSGDIATLNNLITSNTGFIDAQALNWSFTMDENDVQTGGFPATNQMQIVSEDGSPTGYGSATLVSATDDTGASLTVTNDSANPAADWDFRKLSSGRYQLFYMPDPTDEVYLKEPDPRNYNFNFSIIGTSTYTPTYEGALGNVDPYFSNPNGRLANDFGTSGDPFWFVGEDGNPNPVGLGSNANPYIVSRTTGLLLNGYVNAGNSSNPLMDWITFGLSGPSGNPSDPAWENTDPLSATPQNYIFNGCNDSGLATDMGGYPNLNTGDAEVYVFPDGIVQSQNSLTVTTFAPHSKLHFDASYISSLAPNFLYLLKVRVEDCISDGVPPVWGPAGGNYQPTSGVGAKFTYYSTWIKAQ